MKGFSWWYPLPPFGKIPNNFLLFYLMASLSLLCFDVYHNKIFCSIHLDNLIPGPYVNYEIIPSIHLEKGSFIKNLNLMEISNGGGVCTFQHDIS